MDKIKGIYKYGDKWRVRKYDKHIGVYDTYVEAVMAVDKATTDHIADTYWKQYVEARNWLKEQGLISQ